MSEPFWTPLGGQPVDYEGAWGAGTQYAPGDVVTYNGINYLAVNPSLGVTPTPGGLGSLLQDVGAEVAYQEFTSNASITAVTEATAQTLVTAPAFTADGSSQYLVEYFNYQVNTPPVASAYLVIVLYLDGVSIGPMGLLATPAAVVTSAPLRLTRRLTPAAGSRVFSARAYVSSGSGLVAAGVGGSSGVPVPGFIRVTKIPSAVAGIQPGYVPATAMGTTLPASPVDGQEFVLVDSLTAPTYSWRFRYVAAKASNKWVFIGGTPGFAEVQTGEATTSTTYAALTTAGPSFTIPVAGDYDVVIGARIYLSVDNQTAFMSYAIGAATALDADGISYFSGATLVGSFTLAANFVKARRKAALAAATVLAARYKTQSGTATISDRWMQVVPVAVGG